MKLALVNERALEQAQKIYEDVSKWLGFLEVKHAGLLTAYVALFVVAVENDFSHKLWALVALVSGLVITGASFIPFLNRSKWIMCRARGALKEKNALNRVFYQSIFAQSYQVSRNLKTGQEILCNTRLNYKTYFLKEFPGETWNMGSLLDDYLDQIVEVSAVASIKAWWFKIACSISLIYALAFVVIVVCIAQKNGSLCIPFI